MFYVVDYKLVSNREGTLKIIDTSDGVVDTMTFREVEKAMKKQNIAVFGVRPLKSYTPAEGVFNKHIASIILGRGLIYLCRIQNFNAHTLGFATEFLSCGEYGFEDFEYKGVVWSGIMTQDMCHVGYDIIVKSTDKFKGYDLPKCLDIVNETMLHIEVSPDTILHLHIGNPTDESRDFGRAMALMDDLT